MLKQQQDVREILLGHQPPSGGCVLKHSMNGLRLGINPQPPSGGCVLKPLQSPICGAIPGQPPSGGCVLKHKPFVGRPGKGLPAAFRRLCVETSGFVPTLAACVIQPPSGGCVLKQLVKRLLFVWGPSRLQAAVC